jgi:protein-tyrosine-phosphatase
MFKKRIKNNKRVRLQRGTRVLFVCYGNHARSPMAEGLAKKRFGRDVLVESAGVNPLFEGAADFAVQVMKEEYGIDISAHNPKHVRDMVMDRIDYVVAMDPAVYEILAKIHLVPQDKLILWRIEDPFSSGLKNYLRAAEKLYNKIQETFDISELEELEGHHT